MDEGSLVQVAAMILGLAKSNSARIDSRRQACDEPGLHAAYRKVVARCAPGERWHEMDFEVPFRWF